MVRTQVRERTSSTGLTADGGPLGTLPGGVKLELAQGASTGITTVEVSHASGNSETLSASFAFR